MREGLPDSRRLAILLMITCGYRTEEVIGLTWQRFDEKRGTLSIVEVRTQDDPNKTKPKSEKSKRTTPLHPEMVRILKAWKEKQSELLKKNGLDQNPFTHIITSAIGTDMHPNNLRRWWNKWRGKNGFEGVHFHQFRHTYATNLMASGVDIISASSLLGDSEKMVKDVYAHAVTDNLIVANKKLGDSILK